MQAQVSKKRKWVIGTERGRERASNQALQFSFSLTECGAKVMQIPRRLRMASH
jgi:hypothetical protein